MPRRCITLLHICAGLFMQPCSAVVVSLVSPRHAALNRFEFVFTGVLNELANERVIDAEHKKVISQHF